MGKALPSGRILAAALILTASTFAASTASAGGGPENVLLLVNANSESSKTIANHYILWRKIPASNVIYIDWKRGVTACNGNQFRNEILQPILDAIKERKLGMQIDYVVYSSDFPWFVDLRNDFQSSKLPTSFTPVASLTGATYLWQYVQLKNAGIVSPAVNWYVPKSPAQNKAACVQLGNVSSRAFRFHYLWLPSGRRTTDTEQGQRYLMSMMLGVTSGRGNTVDEVLAYLRRSINADATRPTGTFYFMKRGGPRSRPRHDCYAEAAAKLKGLGVGAEVLNGSVPQNRADVLGIMAGVSNFDLDKAHIRILPGAVCDHLTSLGGNLRRNASQTPLTEFLRHGAAGACGTVIEPYAIQAKFPLPSLPLHYVRGCSLAEAFYQSVAGPYQLLIVGDPLCQPWAVPLGVTVDGLAADQVVSGTITLKPSIVATSKRSARFFEVYVDGVLQSRVAPAKSVPLDTTELADGFHELRVVGVESDPVETQGRVILPFEVSNREKKIALRVTPAGVVSAGSTLEVTAQQPGVDEIVIFSNGRELDRASGERSTISLTASSLGRGPIYVQAKSVGVSPAISKPILLNVR